MKKMYIFGFAIMLLVSVVGVATGGSFENEVVANDLMGDVVEIYTWEDLHNMRDDLAGNYVLMNDLGPSDPGYDDYASQNANDGAGWLPVGEFPLSPDYGEPFTGTFDGQNHTITGLYIHRPSTNVIGLFGFVDSAVIKKVGMVDVDISGLSEVGGLVGVSNDCLLERNYATGSVNGEYLVGGLVGYNIESSMSNCFFSGNVSGIEFIGGLFGANSGTVSNSYYNIDSVQINGGHHITIGGIFNEQYADWFNNDMYLNIEDYEGTLVPVDGFYEIRNTDGLRDMLGFADREGYKFRLAADMDLSDESGLYVPYLAAEFYGNNHTISNLHIDIPFVAFTGLFGFLNNGIICDVGLIDTDVSGIYYVGGLVGYNLNGTISNSYATGTGIGTGGVGGLVGVNLGTVSNSYATGYVSGEFWIGGLLGANWDGMVENSYTTASVSGDGVVGGLVGYNVAGGTIEDSYATGPVTGNNIVGGLVGENWEGMVRNSYSTGPVSGDEQVGGLVGAFIGGTVENSFWDVETSGMDTSDGGVGKTTTEMMDITTFLNGGWDIAPIADPYDRVTEKTWNILDGCTYPFLSWQGDLVFDIHSLVINVHGEGSTDPMEGTHQYVAGAEVTVTAVPAEGWRFVEWTGDHEGTEEEITVTMDHDVEITAHFQEIPCYDLRINVEGSGTIEPEEGNHTYEENTEVTLKAVPSEGWIFTGWEGDVPTGNESKDEITLVMDSHKDITAVFEEVRPPTVVITSPLHGATLDTVDVTVEWVSEPGTYPISYHEIQLNMGAWIRVYNVTEYTFTSLENGEHTVTVRAFDTHGNHSEGNVLFYVEVPEPEFIPENLVLVVNPLEGQAPLEVTITVSADNMGDAGGTLTLLVNGSVVHTFNMPAYASAEHNQTYTFETPGIYEISFGNMSKTVTVEDGPGEVTSSGLGMFMWVMILVVIAIVVLTLVIFMGKEGNNDGEPMDDGESVDYTE